MISEERLIWLLGEERPVRVIPARYVATRERTEERPVAPVDPDAHTALGEIEEVDVNHHAWIEGAHIDGVHNTIRLFVDDKQRSHHIVVSSANREALENHLKSASIWLRATPSSPATGPHRIHLEEVLARAVLEETGWSVGLHLSEPRKEKHVNYHDLLGADVAAVRDRAVRSLDDGLEELESAGVIDGEDRSAIGSGRLIDHFLHLRVEERRRASAFEHDHGHAASLQTHPGSVPTRFGPVGGGHDLSFSLRDIGSVPVTGKHWMTIKEYLNVEERVYVEAGGDVDVTFLGYKDGEWVPGYNASGAEIWLAEPGVTVDTDIVTCALGAVRWRLELVAVGQPSSVSCAGLYHESPRTETEISPLTFEDP